MIIESRAEETTAGCCALPETTRDRTKVGIILIIMLITMVITMVMIMVMMEVMMRSTNNLKLNGVLLPTTG